MRIIMVAGAPAVGKTAVILHILNHIIRLKTFRPAVAKMDCIKSTDESYYKALSIPVITGLSQNLCPDHYLAININGIVNWAISQNSDLLIIETAGLCNRCAPFITKALNICVIDSTSSIKSPEKLGPMVTTAEIIVLTKCDMLSQAEREILQSHLEQLNPTAEQYVVNGITGAGSKKIAAIFKSIPFMDDIGQQKLLHDMPGAVCSYCVGEIRIGQAYHQGIVNYMSFGGHHD
ncbi:GTP-binding protein [Fusibacter sp. 3D3]|uniref:GTP-binding protein n=1 Tax=Fusibacter sp. 3D3 TaxID=1048380 RepID=UPI000852A0F8|nr:GTP-binding protein [Fusibacter sp. 3D3]GAU78866.1 Ni2+-binding GTPase involved in regulation of expression and maturation of hydrogenase [Fusibacter sp. 3D3]